MKHRHTDTHTEAHTQARTDTNKNTPRGATRTASLITSLVAVGGTLIVSVALIASAWTVVERLEVPAIDSATLRVLEELFPEADRFVGVPADQDGTQASQDSQAAQLFPAYDAFSGDDEIGRAFRGSGEGYGGDIRVLVAVDPAGTIKGVRVTAQNETSGLGDVIQEDDFLQRFTGKSRQDQIRIGEDIDNISGATWSTRGTAEAVRDALAGAGR